MNKVKITKKDLRDYLKDYQKTMGYSQNLVDKIIHFFQGMILNKREEAEKKAFYDSLNKKKARS